MSNPIKRIKGTVKYFNLEGGFWGIESDENYLILNFPEQLKSPNSIIQCTIRVEEDMMSISGWGRPAFIVGFSTTV